MIKAEMIKMLQNDVTTHLTPAQITALNTKKTRNAAQAAINRNKEALVAEPLEDITEDEMREARALLEEEINYVKKAMGHGELPLEVYTKVWEECYGQVRPILESLYKFEKVQHCCSAVCPPSSIIISNIGHFLIYSSQN